MKTGTFDKANVCLREPDGQTDHRGLEKVSMTAHPSGILEITHYIKGIRIPENKRTLYVLQAQLVSFTGHGYAN